MTIMFDGLRIEYDDSLLVPRQWTSAQARWAREVLANLPAGNVLELCSGAGHIGLLATAGTGRRLVCVDINPRAAEYARRNAQGAGVMIETRVGRASDVIGPAERFPLIIADPPWVSSAATSQFPADPLPAIDGGPDGLAVVRECVAVISAHLDGVALLQLAPGDEQADAVCGMLAGTPVVAGERRYFDRGTLLRLDTLAAHASDGTL